METPALRFAALKIDVFSCFDMMIGFLSCHYFLSLKENLNLKKKRVNLSNLGFALAPLF